MDGCKNGRDAVNQINLVTIDLRQTAGAAAAAGAVAVINGQKLPDLLPQLYIFHTGTALMLASASAVVGITSIAS